MVPNPSDVFDPPTVGFGEVDQQTPLAKIAPAPATVMLPPEVTVVTSSDDKAVVETIGTAVARVVNRTSLP